MGADLTREGANALYAALWKDHTGVGCLQLHKGAADANAQGGDYGNALQLALTKGLRGILYTCLWRKLLILMRKAAFIVMYSRLSYGKAVMRSLYYC